MIPKTTMVKTRLLTGLALEWAVGQAFDLSGMALVRTRYKAPRIALPYDSLLTTHWVYRMIQVLIDADFEISRCLDDYRVATMTDEGLCRRGDDQEICVIASTLPEAVAGAFVALRLGSCVEIPSELVLFEGIRDPDLQAREDGWRSYTEGQRLTLGWYAIVYGWDASEGLFVGASWFEISGPWSFFMGPITSITGPVVMISGPFASEKEAEDWALEHDYWG